MTPDQDMNRKSEAELRNEIARREEAGFDARVPLASPEHLARLSTADLRSLLALRPKEAGQAGEPVAWANPKTIAKLSRGTKWSGAVLTAQSEDACTMPLYASPPPASPAVTVGVKPALIEQWLIAAYARGVEWNEENPLDREYRFKAAGDWADKALNDPESELCRALTSPAGETAQVEAIPVGWFLVPEVPTDDQMQAGLYQSSHDATYAGVCQSYMDMVRTPVEAPSLSASSLSAKESPEQLREAVIEECASVVFAAAERQSELQKRAFDSGRDAEGNGHWRAQCELLEVHHAIRSLSPTDKAEVGK